MVWPDMVGAMDGACDTNWFLLMVLVLLLLGLTTEDTEDTEWKKIRYLLTRRIALSTGWFVFSVVDIARNADFACEDHCSISRRARTDGLK